MFYDALIASLCLFGVILFVLGISVGPILLFGYLEEKLKYTYYKTFLACVALLAFAMIYVLMLCTVFVGDLHDRKMRDFHSPPQVERTP